MPRSPMLRSVSKRRNLSSHHIIRCWSLGRNYQSEPRKWSHSLLMLSFAMIECGDIQALVDCGNALTHEARRRGWFILPFARGLLPFAPPARN
jgi:hypothetical protein